MITHYILYWTLKKRLLILFFFEATFVLSYQTVFETITGITWSKIAKKIKRFFGLLLDLEDIFKKFCGRETFFPQKNQINFLISKLFFDTGFMP